VSSDPEEEGDWEITKEGLYIARRSFLIRRGYCCANRCRNCPYINWRNQSSWQPLPPACVRKIHVSPKAVAGARAMLLYHEQQLLADLLEQQDYHRAMIKHYRLLLENWE
jgi:hypothetical protein